MGAKILFLPPLFLYLQEKKWFNYRLLKNHFINAGALPWREMAGLGTSGKFLSLVQIRNE